MFYFFCLLGQSVKFLPRGFFHLFDKRRHVPGEGGFQIQARLRRAARGVTGDEEFRGVKAEPGEEGAFLKGVATPVALDGGKQNRLVISVEFVADNGVTEACEVNANLVGSAGFRERLKNAIIPGAAQKAEGGKGLFPPVLVNDGEVLFVPVRHKREVARGLAPRRPAVNRSDVALPDLPTLKGKREGPVGFAVLRENDKPRCFPVDAVNRVELCDPE